MDGNRYAQVFATIDLFVAVYPMAGEGLCPFIHEYCRPEHMTFDDPRDHNGGKTEFMMNLFWIMIKKWYKSGSGTTVCAGFVRFTTGRRILPEG